MTERLELEQMPGRFAVCRLSAAAAVPSWALDAPVVSITRTDRELSIITASDRVPADVKAEHGWVALRVAGTLDFGLVGILARLTGVLAIASIPVVAISTYDTDLLLVREEHASEAVIALRTVADVPDMA
jgi:hypothetical protein